MEKLLWSKSGESAIMIKKLFVRFLKMKNVYREFMHNVISYRMDWFNRKPFNEIMLDDIIRCNGRNLINYAFVWKYTKEGESFWRQLDNEWRFIIGFRI